MILKYLNPNQAPSVNKNIVYNIIMFAYELEKRHTPAGQEGAVKERKGRKKNERKRKKTIQ